MVEKAKDIKDANYKHIVRVANVDLPGHQAIRIALTKIKGVGQQFADAVCFLAKVDKRCKTGNLTDQEVQGLTKAVENPLALGMPTWMVNRRKDFETNQDKHLITGTLVFTKENDLKRLKKIKTLRGIRHQKGLPVRGQRTKSNFRTHKGKVVGVKKKAAPATATPGKTPAKAAKK